jgi:hypothetical protein
MRLSDISYEAVAAWVTGLTKTGVSGASVRHIYRVVPLMMGMAIRDGRLARNPASDVPLPRAANGRQRFLTQGQVVEPACTTGHTRLITCANDIVTNISLLSLAAAPQTCQSP